MEDVKNRQWGEKKKMRRKIEYVKERQWGEK